MISSRCKAGNLGKYIVSYCKMLNKSMNNLKLQQMLYISWFKYYNQTKEYLFFENFCACGFGVAVPNVYYYFCGFGVMPITVEYDVKMSQEVSYIVDSVITEYIDICIYDILEIIQRQGGAWNEIYKVGKAKRAIEQFDKNIIPFALIESLECSRY